MVVGWHVIKKEKPRMETNNNDNIDIDNGNNYTNNI